MAKPATLDLTGLSDKEFMEHWNSVGAEVAVLKKELRRYSKEHDRRVKKDMVGDLMSRMTPEEQKEFKRAVAAQTVSPAGIESEEGVHNG